MTIYVGSVSITSGTTIELFTATSITPGHYAVALHAQQGAVIVNDSSGDGEAFLLPDVAYGPSFQFITDKDPVYVKNDPSFSGGGTISVQYVLSAPA